MRKSSGSRYTFSGLNPAKLFLKLHAGQTLSTYKTHEKGKLFPEIQIFSFILQLVMQQEYFPPCDKRKFMIQCLLSLKRDQTGHALPVRS